MQFGKDELIILGSGGGRYMATTQTRSTGGVVLRAMSGKVQLHLDPGPGAIRDVWAHKIDPRLTNYLVLTHGHTDHNMSLPILVEALQENLKFETKRGTFIAPKGYFEKHGMDSYYLGLLERHIGIEEDKTSEIESGFKVTGIHTEHCEIPNLGYIMDFSNPQDASNQYHYRIAFTSDTANFPEYVSKYKGVDILVVNLLRPNSIVCRGHLCTDEFIPLLKAICPKMCVLIHYGTHFHARVAEQVRKIQTAVGSQTMVIAGEDGLVIPLAKMAKKFGQNSLDSFI